MISIVGILMIASGAIVLFWGMGRVVVDGGSAPTYAAVEVPADQLAQAAATVHGKSVHEPKASEIPAPPIKNDRSEVFSPSSYPLVPISSLVDSHIKVLTTSSADHWASVGHRLNLIFDDAKFEVAPYRPIRAMPSAVREIHSSSPNKDQLVVFGFKSRVTPERPFAASKSIAKVH